jgi:DNA-directed RNA polymerase subunit RPC12/RpoP
MVHAKCNYNSNRVPEGGLVYHPAAMHIDKIKIYNVDQNSENVNDALIMKKIVPDKKKRKTLEQQFPVVCEKHFCSLCLKNFFDVDLDEIKRDPHWVCPYCAGQCFCSRCRR